MLTDSVYDRAPGDLSRRVAHALGSPLGVLVGALDTAPGDNPELYAGLARLARRGTAQLKRLSARLALLGRLDARSEPNLAPCDLAALAQGASATISATRVRRGVTLGTEFSEQHGPAVGDGALIEAAYAELIDNAMRFSTSRVTVSLAASEQTVAFWVQHDGDALTPEVFGAALDRTAPLQDRSGLGIGLWIADTVARLHAGSLAQGHEGQVILTLPRSA